MLTRYVTLSVGDRHDLTARAHLAVLAMMAHAPQPAEICIVTDRPELFRWFGERLRLLIIDAATLAAWKGRHDFFWRVELMTVVHTAAQGPAHVVYFDSDVLARASLAPLVEGLASGDVFMHLHEHNMASRRCSGDRQLWRQMVGREAGGVHFSAPCPMWNAGVIAVGAANHPLLGRALGALDGLMDGGIHHNMIEQLAISTVFAATGRLRPAAQWLDHFWENKAGYSREIDRQLAEIHYRGMSVDDAVSYVHSHPIIRPLRVRRRWWNRLLRPPPGTF